MGSSKAVSAWTDFCWQGITMEAPADWELGAASGDHESGYVRLDGMDMVRLEMRWERARGKLTAREVVDNHLKQAEKDSRRAGQKTKQKRDIGLVRPPGVDCECFSFDAEAPSFGMVRRCPECGRNVFVRMMYRKGESARSVAQRIFGSLRDHPEGDRMRWRFFGFEFETPASAKLRERSLKTGCLEMLFRRGRDEMEFVRVSLAEIQLKKKGLRHWFEEFYGKRLRAYRGACKEEEFRGHKGLLYTGEAKLLRPIVTLLRLRRDLWARVWRCEKTDKLFVFRVTAKARDAAELMTFVDSVRCH